MSVDLWPEINRDRGRGQNVIHDHFGILTVGPIEAHHRDKNDDENQSVKDRKCLEDRQASPAA